MTGVNRVGPAGYGIALLTLSGLLAAAPAAQAGPWTKSGGEFYIKGGESFFSASTFVDSTGTVREGVNYFGASTFAYFEVGLFKGFQVQGYLPFTVARNTFPDGARYLHTGGGDALIGIQWSPPIPGLTSAIRLEFKVPMYDVGGIKGNYATRFPAFGDGQLDITPWLSIGGGIPRTPLYAWAEAGYRFRTEGYVGEGDTREFLDSFAFAGQIGVGLGNRGWAGFTVSGVTPFKLDEVTKAYLVLGPSIGIFVYKNFALEASFDPIVWARNGSQGLGFSVGASIKR